MMCLGWSTKSSCAARPPINANTGQTIPDTLAQQTCGDITWFWAGLAVALLGLLRPE
jgi:hypothetical protein